MEAADGETWSYTGATLSEARDKASKHAGELMRRKGLAVVDEEVTTHGTQVTLIFDYEPSGSPRAIEADLRWETEDWSEPSVVREYPGNDHGRWLYAAELRVFAAHGYSVVGQTEAGGHLHAGRLIATGGLSVLAGKRGTRATGTLTVTYHKAAEDRPKVEDLPTLLERLAQLRRAGVLTDEEFASKKAELLARL